jgi:hypothetical protein
MKMRAPFFLLSLSIVALPVCVIAASSTHNPTWWDKYQFMKNQGPDAGTGPSISLNFNGNIDISNECGPQSETNITINPSQTKNLAAGSNEIFRLPMRGYFSTNGGTSWGGVDLPLPPSQGSNSINFGSDPGLAFDTRGNVFYSYIVVFFGNGNGVNGTEMAVARSTDGGQTYPTVNFFGFEGGSNHFNDKPMITTDKNSGSAFRDNVYVAWDAAVGGSTGGGIRVGTSSDHGASFTITRADDPSGPGRSIGACPAVGTNGELYVAWNDYLANAIMFNRSNDAGNTWGTQLTISTKNAAFDVGTFQQNHFAARSFIRCSMSTVRADRIAVESIVRGWTRPRRERPTFIFRIRTTKAGIGRRAKRWPINCQSWSTDSITGCRSIQSPAT